MRKLRQRAVKYFVQSHTVTFRADTGTQTIWFWNPSFNHRATRTSSRKEATLIEKTFLFSNSLSLLAQNPVNLASLKMSPHLFQSRIP